MTADGSADAGHGERIYSLDARAPESHFNVQLDGLNSAQREAVEHGAGPLLLLAGAGSGKTRVVTHRIARLLAHGHRGDSIIALTFTNRAAHEMKERIERLVGRSVARTVTVSTFHALGARFLRQHSTKFSRTHGFSIYDDDDQLDAIRQVLTVSGIKPDRGTAREIRGAINQVKNAGRHPEPSDMPIDILIREGADVATAYESHLRRADAFDFGDLIVRPADALAADPCLVGAYRARWQWILVDEFQDTNAAQYRWLQLLAPPGSNLCVVGDDDQSIYAWRGACVRNILEFPEDYPRAHVIRLEENFRSSGYILRAANAVIDHNSGRLGKTLWTSADDGPKLELHEANDGRDEGQWVARQVLALCTDEGFEPGDCAVFYRANSLSLDLEEALTHAGVPYVVVRGRSFYDRSEVRTALAYARLLVNPADDVAFRRAVGSPTRGVGKKSLERLAAFATEHDMAQFPSIGHALAASAVVGRARRGLETFAAVVSEVAATVTIGLQPSRLLHSLLDRAGFLEWLDVEDRSTGDASKARRPNVDRLLEALEAFEVATPDGALADWLQQVQLVSEVDAAALDGGAVSLMTIHAAKGLEFPVVFVIGLEEGIFPHARVRLERELEEERRLCYVALTRAERRLFLSNARVRRVFGEVRACRPSRFMREVPDDTVELRYVIDPAGFPRSSRRRWGQSGDEHEVDLGPSDDFGSTAGAASEFRSGMMVWHPEFGAGRVVDVGRDRLSTLTIDFPDIGHRKIVARFVSPYDA